MEHGYCPQGRISVERDLIGTLTDSPERYIGTEGAWPSSKGTDGSPGHLSSRTIVLIEGAGGISGCNPMNPDFDRLTASYH